MREGFYQRRSFCGCHLLDGVALKSVRCLVLEAMRLRDVSYGEMVKHKVETAVGDTSTSVVVKGKENEEAIGIEKEGITTGRSRSLSKQEQFRIASFYLLDKLSF